MKLKAYYHIYMINDWEAIVKEQLRLIVKSGLYEQLDSFKIGAIGEDIDRLKKIISKYPKCEIARSSDKADNYEFFTLETLHTDCNEDFYGLYFHTKSVSFPKNKGGKYWRDYMNHFCINQCKECQKKLRKGFDTCGVKLLTKEDKPAHKVHYSGNFWWFKSSYVRRLVDPATLNQKDRYQAEFWIGTGDPNAATLSQEFVDYNTRGTFHDEGINYVHTLAYNLPSETEKSVKLLYEQNDNFKHYIVDLGFPISDHKLPKDIDKAKKVNSDRLKDMCVKYGSTYLKMDNIGVSQNWDNVFKYLKMSDNDVLIGLDPDERTLNNGWVNAMADTLRSGYGLVSLMMTDHVNMLEGKRIIEVDGVRCMPNPSNINWALIGMSGKFLKGMKSVPFPPNAKRYGWIEAMIRPYFAKLKTDWCVLPDYKVRHTDFELGDKGASQFLREWKNLIIFEIKKYGQISLEEFIERKLNKEL